MLDSGVSEHFQLKPRGPTNSGSQGGNVITWANNSEIAIIEFRNEFVRLLSLGTLQQVNPADLLTRQVSTYRPTKSTQEQQATYNLNQEQKKIILKSQQEIIDIKR